MTELVVAPKKTIAIAVMIAFIIVCVLAPFGAAHAIVGVSTAAITILIAALAAVGITFTTTGAFDSLEEYVENLLQEYAQDNNIPLTSIFNGASWQSNAAGKLLLNHPFLNLISLFATWIKAKYSLANNSIQTIVDGSVVNGIITTKIPYSYIAVSSGIRRENYYVSSTDPVYLIFYRSKVGGSTYYNTMAYSSSEFTIVWSSRDMPNGTPSIQQFNSELYNTSYFVNVGSSSSQSWTASGSTAPIDKVYIDPSSNVANTVYNHIRNALDGNYPAGDTIGIKTGSINIPVSGTDYTDDDGAILDVDAPWSIPVSGVINTVPDAWSSVEDDTTIYTLDVEAEDVIEQQLPQPSDIENLPGATIPGIPDIDGEPWHLEFSNLWHYVAQWINDISAGGAVIWNTCIQAPPPVVNLVFVGIVLAMWFGAIKILR